MTRLWYFFGPVVPVLVLFLAAPAAAKNISIQMTPVPELRDGTFNVQLAITNLGDEAAQSVVPSLRFRDQDVRGTGKASLGPNETISETLSVPAADLAQGRWPYRLTVDYTDANQYPFQALHVPTLTVGNPPPVKVAVREMKASQVSGSGTLSATLKNLEGNERSVALQAHVPEGLEAATTATEVRLAAWEEKAVSVPLTNRTALAGSRLPVFLTMQYDDGGVHQGIVAQTVVEVIPQQSFFSRQRELLWAGVAVLLLAWGGFVLTRMMRRS
jgi:hypothetical protein